MSNYLTTNNSDANKKIAKNTLFLYARMLIILFISIYSSRLILNTLGVVDFGIYNVVGGFVGVMTIISAGFSNSSQRFITYSIGENNKQKTHLTFVTILNIHYIFAILLLVLGETAGLWFVNHYLVIPSNRIIAANLVYQLSLLTIIVNLISIPYNAIITSHERLNIFALVSIIESVLKLIAIIFLNLVNSDLLITYALFLAFIALLIQIFYVLYCRSNFNESRYQFIIDIIIFKDILKYVSWAYLGNFAGILKEQGLNIIINMFFGVTINAARAIAMQVYNSVNSMSANLITAFNPQIVKTFASGNFDRSLSLTKNSTRYSLFLLLFFTVPILIETEFILKLWLNNVPDHSVVFVKLILILCLSRAIQQPIITFYLAIGKIKKSQIISSILVVISVAICYILFKMGAKPEISIIVSIFSEIIGFMIILYLTKELVDFSILHFLEDIFYKVIPVMIFAFFLPMIFFYNMNEGFVRLIMVSLSSFLSIVLFTYLVGMTKYEKSQLQIYISKKIYNGIIIHKK